jgi:hypothetical protein
MNSKFVSLLLVLVTFVISGCGVTSYRGQVNYDLRPEAIAYAAGPQEAIYGPTGVSPKDVAFLDFAPRTCGDGPLSLEIKNESGNFVALQFDGMDVHVMGAHGELPSFVPPNHTLYLCLDVMGQHSITGTQYTPSGSQMVKVFDFHWNGEFTASKRHTAQLVGGVPGILI